ncbi:unnamed protein product [Kluyveromyces dobzhanskii CBS 2104]|uniref:WGS project CCBQ000000000 data, contig 00015 n=1 Tax=Kluyveromyces dobzhanskii CBS 2104 TaxID=1427455 RepID=A0A0A8L947_9SACH|nr:unnamed protein product [Kluyveromyces dobzhanskii CBS 2104]
MDPAFDTDGLSWGSNVPPGKRQRIYNMVKHTKDTYFNAAKNSIKNYYGNDMSPAEARAVEFQMFPPKLLCYPSYARKLSDSVYLTELRGLLYSTGHRSKRNSILMSICKQFLRNDPPPNVEQRLESLQNDSTISLESTSTASSSTGSDLSSIAEGAVPLTQEQVLKERIAGFMNKNLPNVHLQTSLFNESNEMVDRMTISDSSGGFNLLFESDFKPFGAKVKCLDTGLVQECPIFYVENSGVALISDIDDTIKHTGVAGDKRSIFLNVFVNGFEHWMIQDMPIWYKTLKDSKNVDFFYVSNAPAQIYPILSEYIAQNYPVGPIFLKQYSGNLLSSIMKSSAQRKLASILKICKDFPKKKFILVGDSGEQDLEAYISTACQFPNQIIGIYIRCCKNSMSDEPENDVRVMKTLNEYIGKFYIDKMPHEKTIPDLISFDSDSDSETVAKIKHHNNHPKIAPQVPKQKPILSSDMQREIYESKSAPTRRPLPHGKPTQLKKGFIENEVYSIPSSQNDYGTYSEFFDKRAEGWNERVKAAVEKLKANNLNTKFMFFMDPLVCLEDSINKIDSLSQRNEINE